MNSSSNVQCHDPDGAATGGAVPAHGPRSAGAAGPGDVLGTAAGADARAAAGPGAPLCVEEYVVDPPPGDAETDDGGEEVVVVVVGLGHRSTICWYCVQSPRPVDPPPDPVAEPFARALPRAGASDEHDRQDDDERHATCDVREDPRAFASVASWL